MIISIYVHICILILYFNLIFRKKVLRVQIFDKAGESFDSKCAKYVLGVCVTLGRVLLKCTLRDKAFIGKPCKRWFKQLC